MLLLYRNSYASRAAGPGAFFQQPLTESESGRGRGRGRTCGAPCALWLCLGVSAGIAVWVSVAGRAWRRAGGARRRREPGGPDTVIYGTIDASHDMRDSRVTRHGVYLFLPGRRRR